MAIELARPAPSPAEVAARIDLGAVSAGVADEILRRCYAAYAADPEFVTALHCSVHANIGAIRGVLAGQLELEAVRPTEALAFAELSAALAIPVATLERAYLVGVADFWRQWCDSCSAVADEYGIPLADLLRDSTLRVFAYIDHVLIAVVNRYDEARTEMIRTREHLRRSALQRIIGGGDPGDRLELERALGYPVLMTHLAVALEATDRAEVERRARGLREATGAAGVLVHQSGAATWTIWLARPQAFTRREITALAVRLDGARAAVSEPWAGVAGVRRTYEEVAAAAAIRADGVVLYRDVRLDVLLLADPDRARRFVTEELGDLAGPDPRLRLIREALLVWLSTGSHVAAGAHIGVHENTVRNRVRQAEELLPDGVTLQRRTELQVALRLRRALAPAPAAIGR